MDQQSLSQQQIRHSKARTRWDLKLEAVYVVYLRVLRRELNVDWYQTGATTFTRAELRVSYFLGANRIHPRSPKPSILHAFRMFRDLFRPWPST